MVEEGRRTSDCARASDKPQSLCATEREVKRANVNADTEREIAFLARKASLLTN
jgi:hypothetical protein